MKRQEELFNKRESCLWSENLLLSKVKSNFLLFFVQAGNNLIERQSIAKAFLIILILILSTPSFAQTENSRVSIGTKEPNPNAVLTLESPEGNQGILVPRLTSTQRELMADVLTVDDIGLIIFDKDIVSFFYWNGNSWQLGLSSPTGSDFIAGEGISVISGIISNTGDLSETNEIQDLSLNNNILNLSQSSQPIDLSAYLDNTDSQTASEVTYDNTLSGLISTNVKEAIDEVQNNVSSFTDTDTQLSEAEVDTYVSNNGYLTSEVDGSTTNEIQNLGLTGTQLSIEGGNTIDLAVVQDGFEANTDNQELSLTGSTLAITGGNTVELASFTDTDDQTLTFDGTTLTISEGNVVDLSVLATDTQLSEAEVDAFADNNGYLTSEVDGSITNEIQNLGLTGTKLSIDGANTIDLAVVQDGFEANTDNQELSLTGSTLAITGGNSIELASFTDTDDQTLTFDGTTLTISEGNVVDLSVLATDTQLSEAEVDAFADNNGYLTSEVDGSTTNELNTIFQVNAGNLELTDAGGTLQVPLTSIDTDNQNLALSGTQLSIEGGNVIDLAVVQDGFEANTDNQELSLTGSTLAITGGNTVELVSFTDTDDQTLTFDGTNLTISEGNVVDLSVLATDTQLSEAEVDAFADNNGYLTSEVDGSTTNEIQNLGLTGTQLSIEGGNTIDLAVVQDGFEANTDNQELSLTGSTLAITGGNTVELASFTDTDDQTLTFDGTNLTISEGNVVDLSVLATDTQLSEAEVDTYVSNNGYLTSEIDGSITNELNTTFQINAGNLELKDAGGTLQVPLTSIDTDNQNLALSGTQLSIEGGNVIDLAVVQDGFEANTDNQELSLTGSTLAITGGNSVELVSFTDTDDQTASEVTYDNNISGLFSTNVKDAIDEVQNNVSSFTDTDTQLSEAEVDTYVSNNGYLTSEVDGSTTNELNTTFQVNAGNLELTDAGGTLLVPLTSIDTDNQTALEVIYDNTLSGLISTNIKDAIDEVQNNVSSFTDTDTQLSEAEVDTYVSNNGYLTSEVDGSTTNELNATFQINAGNLELTDAGGTLQVPLTSIDTDDQTALEVSYDNTLSGLLSTNVKDAIDEVQNNVSSFTDTDTQLSEAEVDTYVSNNGYLTSEVDGSTTNELNTLFQVNAGNLELTDAGGTLLVPLTSIDTDTQLSEAEVDTYVSNNGYLTSEIDGSITNEIQSLSLTGTTLAISGGNSVELASFTDTDDQTALEVSYDNTLSGLLSTNVKDAIDEVQNNVSSFTDTDTQLSEAEVDAFADNNGYLTSEVDGSITNELNTTFQINAGNLELTDAGGTLLVPLTSIDTDDQTALEVIYDNTLSGLISTNIKDAIDEVQNNVSSFTDTDTQLSEAEVDTYVNNNGYLTSEVDGSTTNELNTIFQVNAGNLELKDAGGTLLVPLTSIDTDDQNLALSGTQLSIEGGNIIDLAVVQDGYEANTDNQQLSLTGTTLAISGGNSVELASFTDTDDQTASEVTYDNTLSGLLSTNVKDAIDEVQNNVSSFTDTDTQLSEAEVDTYVNNNGYLTSEVDGSTTNELNTTFQVNAGNLELTDAGGTLLVPLTSINTDDQTAIEVPLTPSGSLVSSDLQNGMEELQSEIVINAQNISTLTLAQVISNGTSANNKITNVTDPVDPQDAATKAYVDLLEARLADLEARVTALDGGSSSSTTISTVGYTNITESSAVINSEITDDGGITITERGITWATTIDPVITANDFVIDASTGIGTYSLSATGLTSSTFYYVRAYAKNSNGEVFYANTLQFTTASPKYTVTTYEVMMFFYHDSFVETTFEGDVFDNTGNLGMDIMEKGFFYNTTGDPTFENGAIQAPLNMSGTGGVDGYFSSDLVYLNYNETFYIKAYTLDMDGTYYYGNEVIFQTPEPYDVNTIGSSFITETSADLQGEILDSNATMPMIMEAGMVYSVNPNVDLSNGTKEILDFFFDFGPFTVTPTTLTAGTTYYYRAYAIDDYNNIVYGDELSFTTLMNP